MKILLLLTPFFSLLITNTVFADSLSSSSQEFNDTRYYFSSGYNANHMHYKELVGEDTLDEEYGKLHGFYINSEYKSPNYYELILGKPFIKAYYRYFADKIRYDGGTSAGDPFSFDTNAKVHQYGAKLGAYSNSTFLDKFKFLAYLDIGRRIWYRGENGIIDGVIVYAEKYEWIYFGIGFGTEYSFDDKFSAGIDIESMFSPNSWSRMRADLYEGGTFNIKRVSGVELTLPIKYYLTQNIGIELTPYFTYWHISDSDPTEISGDWYYEPKSRTHIEGIIAGISYRF